MGKAVSQQDERVDLVVIGSGVAGALAARELAAAGYSVVILEAGGRWHRSDAAERYRGAVERNLQSPFEAWPWLAMQSDPAAAGGHAQYHPLFLQGVGGTTWHWTGMTPRFLPEDFEMQRRYGVGENWPISYDDLEPFYVQAEQALGVSGDSRNDHGSPRSAPYPMPEIPMTYGDKLLASKLASAHVEVAPLPAARNSHAFDGRPACRGNNTCTPLCPIGAAYSAEVDVAKAVRFGARLVTQAVAYRFDIDHEQRLAAVHYKHPDGSSQRLTAARFIVACNSIETARLLLMATGERSPQGLANASGQVGRNLMDHALFVREFTMPEPLYIGRGPQSVSTLLTGRSGKFRRHYGAAKFFLGNDLNIQQMAAGLLKHDERWKHVMDDLRHAATHQGKIGAEIETLPESGNRLTLDLQRLDPLGLPLAELHYQLGAYAGKGVEKWQTFADDLIDKVGGKVSAASFGLSSHHPAGTARMGSKATTSVVNENCRSHQHDNLYIVGGSVFPTLGTANPTLTIAALSLRLAAHIKQKDRRPV